LKCLQGGRAHPLAACGVATLCCRKPKPSPLVPCTGLTQVEAWGLAEETADEKLATELATVREFMLQPSEVRKRAMVDDTFVTAKQSYAWTQVRAGDELTPPFQQQCVK
jgi:hypothetical protein